VLIDVPDDAPAEPNESTRAIAADAPPAVVVEFDAPPVAGEPVSLVVVELDAPPVAGEPASLVVVELDAPPVAGESASLVVVEFDAPPTLAALEKSEPQAVSQQTRMIRKALMLRPSMTTFDLAETDFQAKCESIVASCVRCGRRRQHWQVCSRIAWLRTM
jgi:hypothetical protein